MELYTIEEFRAIMNGIWEKYGKKCDIDAEKAEIFFKLTKRLLEENEKYNLTSQTIRKSEMEELHFYPPMRGMITTEFNPNKQHYGIDITATNDKNVCSVLDGSILMSGYTADHGYVVIVQHVGNLVTIYKHLSVVFHGESTKVKAGEVLGIAGIEGEKTSTPFLHFEIWHKGVALDPAQYISF